MTTFAATLFMQWMEMRMHTFDLEVLKEQSRPIIDAIHSMDPSQIPDYVYFVAEDIENLSQDGIDIMRALDTISGLDELDDDEFATVCHDKAREALLSEHALTKIENMIVLQYENLLTKLEDATGCAACWTFQ